MRKLEGRDVSVLVVGSLVIILGICTISITAVLASHGYKVASYVFNFQFATGAWVLLCGIIAILAGLTGHSGAYIAVIVLTILGTLMSIGGLITVPVGVLLAAIEGKSADIALLLNLSYGLMIIDSISFILLIVCSSIACCGGACCKAQSVQPMEGGGAAIAMVPAATDQPGTAQHVQHTKAPGRTTPSENPNQPVKQ